MVNPWAVVVAGIAGFGVGMAWYMALGGRWVAALGWSAAEAEAARAKPPVGPMIVAILAQWLMALMLAGLVAHLSGSQPTARIGVITGAACWLGFVLPTMLVNYAFQRRRPMLTVIDGGHWLAVLVVEGAIIGAFG